MGLICAESLPKWSKCDITSTSETLVEWCWNMLNLLDLWLGALEVWMGWDASAWSAQGATLQNYNNALVKSIEAMGLTQMHSPRSQDVRFPEGSNQYHFNPFYPIINFCFNMPLVIVDLLFNIFHGIFLQEDPVPQHMPKHSQQPCRTCARSVKSWIVRFWRRKRTRQRFRRSPGTPPRVVDGVYDLVCLFLHDQNMLT